MTKLRLPLATNNFDLDCEAGVGDVPGGVWRCLVHNIDLDVRRIPSLAKGKPVDVTVEGDNRVATSSGLRLHARG